jgi:hypothetical protein
LILPKDIHENNEHLNASKSLSAAALLKAAQTLVSKRNTNANHYIVKLMSDPSYPSIFRDRAAINYLVLGFDLIRTNAQIPEESEEAVRLLKALKKCATILARKDSAYPKDRATAKMFLGFSNSPVFGTDIFYTRIKSSFGNSVKAVQYLKEALEFPELEPTYRASVLNELGALYSNGFLGINEEVYKNALEYYTAIDQNNEYPVVSRLQSQFNQVRVLAALGIIGGTGLFEQRRLLISSIKDHPEASQQLLNELMFEEVSLLMQMAGSKEDPAIKKKALEEAFVILKSLNEVKEFDASQVRLRNGMYADVTIYLVLYYDYPIKLLEQVLPMLGSFINQEQREPINFWASSVLSMAGVMYVTQRRYPDILGKSHIGDLLDEVATHPSIYPTNQSQAKSLKAILTAKGIIKARARAKEKERENEKDQIFDAFTEALQDHSLPAYIRLNTLVAFSQEVQKFYPKYNTRIKQVIELLKKVLKEENGLRTQQKIKFILLQYYLAYKKCDINNEEAKMYALDLSRADVPTRLNMKEFLEKIIGSDTFETQETHNKIPTLLPEKEASLPNDLPKLTHNEEKKESLFLHQPTVEKSPISAPRYSEFPTPSQPKKPDNVVRYDPFKDGKEKGVKEERDLEKAEFLLERLQSRRGKVSQSEVANMLRRLNYTFEPSQDEGFTIHTGHKGKGNKKGSTGVLKGGARTDCADVLKDALKKKAGRKNN